MTAKKLTDKQEMFCREYLADLNGTQAAIRAGYSKRSARLIGSENLGKPEIQGRLQALMDARAERVEVDADYVLKRLIEIDEMDVADILSDSCEILPVRDWPQCWRRTLSGLDVSELWDGKGDEREVSGLLKKIKWPDKVKNLELLGKHVKVQAFKDKLDVEGTVAVERVERIIVDPEA